ncbi:hypothetical protein EJB05_36263, partial [Eragrostis curvula]
MGSTTHGELCATSAECKTVMTAVLTVKSGLDFFMIRWDWLDDHGEDVEYQDEDDFDPDASY